MIVDLHVKSRTDKGVIWDGTQEVYEEILSLKPTQRWKLVEDKYGLELYCWDTFNWRGVLVGTWVIREERAGVAIVRPVDPLTVKINYDVEETRD